MQEITFDNPEKPLYSSPIIGYIVKLLSVPAYTEKITISLDNEELEKAIDLGYIRIVDNKPMVINAKRLLEFVDGKEK